MLGIIATSALAQSQWRNDNLWGVVNNRWQPTNACRMPQPGKPTAFLVYQCTDRNRTPILQVDLKQVPITGWVYVNFPKGEHFRYKYQGEVVPDVDQWYVYAGPGSSLGTWPQTTQVAAAARAQAAAQQREAARKGTEAQVTATIQLPYLYGGLAGQYGSPKSAAAVFSDALTASAGHVW